MASEFSVSRKQATIAIVPFVLLGLADVALLVLWGLDPLWGFMILPPILFVSVIGWIGFRSGFARDRLDPVTSDSTDETDSVTGDDPSTETTTDSTVTEETAVEEELA